MFQIDSRDVRGLEADLQTFARQAFPKATRDTVNRAAFAARRFAQEGIRNGMTLRNKFTAASVRVEATKSLNVFQQASTVGSIADYMADQEFGSIKTKKGGEGLPIATSFSAGQGQNAQPRTRLPRRANMLATIRLSRRGKKGKGRKQQNLIAIKQAATGTKYVFLDLGRRKGIFKVTGGKRRPKIKMVHDLTRQAIVVPRNPWLAPAVARVDVATIYFEALTFHARRQGLFN